MSDNDENAEFLNFTTDGFISSLPEEIGKWRIYLQDIDVSDPTGASVAADCETIIEKMDSVYRRHVQG